MNILQVVPYFFPAYAFGGPAKVTYQIARELVKRKHNVSVYTSDAKDLDSRLITDSAHKVTDGINVQYMRNISQTLVKESKMFITPQLISSVVREIRKFDVVHLHEYRTTQNIIVHHYAKKFGVPYVLQAHGSLSRIMTKQRLKWIYDVLFGRRLLNDASRFIALSQTESQQYESMGVSEEKIDIVPNGIDLSEYADLPPKGAFKKKFGIKMNKKIVLYLGRIHKTKRIDFLLNAYACLDKNFKCNNTTLVIAGPDDGYAVKVKSLASSLDLFGSLLVTGPVSNEDKTKALVDADVFVSPSFYGFPITFLEACAVGTPLITTTLGDTLEWINNNVGYVTPPRQIDFARAIHKTISNRELRACFSRNCREIARSKFSMNEVVDKLEQIYTEIAEK